VHLARLARRLVPRGHHDIADLPECSPEHLSRCRSRFSFRMFVERNSLDITPLTIHSSQLSQTWKALPDGFFLFDWISQTPSFSRAWIHRERQLARRVLHFTDKEMIWECCGIEGTSFASEMFPGECRLRMACSKMTRRTRSADFNKRVGDRC
jgi:hypothetical protein